MKRYFILLSILIYSGSIYGQNLDLIVTLNGDSIACTIDKITADVIYFETFQNKTRINTSLDRKSISDYNKRVIMKNDISRIEGTIFFHTKRANPKNNIYLNIFGDASLISINYERIFRINSGFSFACKLGFGRNEEALIFNNNPDKYTTLTQGLSGNFRIEGRNYLEVGLGSTIIPGNPYQPFLFYPILGFRIQPLRSGKMNFRIFGSIPFTGLDTDVWFVPVGICFGLSF